MRTRDPVALVEILHPNDELGGEHTGAAAHQAAELLRYLTHAVQGSDAAGSVPDPQTADTVIAATVLMTTRLRSLLEHLAARARRLAEDPRATVDATGRQHGGPDTVADLAGINLESAASRLGEAAALLRTAQALTGSLHVDQTDPDAREHIDG